MKINEFAKEVHANACEKGWWDEPRTFGEIIALCHSELSEALEEFRAGRPMVWYSCTEIQPYHPCDPKDSFDCQMYGKEECCKYRGKKPEGIAVELADCIIRILDYLGKKGADVDRLMMDAGSAWRKADCTSLGDYIADLHFRLSIAYANVGYDAGCCMAMAACINSIMEWAKATGVDMEAVMKGKHEYNKGRPYRHGGKVL